jgi:glycosyltransferase involved in cell wall biosynthesis/ribosomal protein S18 acetylase RimI-like enzyme
MRIAHVTTVDMTLRFLLLKQMQHERAAGFDIIAVSAPGPWVREVAAAGIRHIPWGHATRAWDPAADAAATRELVAILRANRFDLVHTHTPKAGVIGRLAARACGVPAIVNTVHGFYVQPSDPPLKRLGVLGLERLAARCSDLELYESAEDLGWFHPPHGVLLGAGVDVAVQPPAPRDDGIVRVGTVCRLVGEKGVREFIAAARALASERVVFVAVGAPDREKADALTPSELERASEHVELTGWRDDARDLVADLDVFVLASWREGLPRAALEAAAAGKALVLTDVRGCRDVARDGIEALLVPPRDAQRLTAAISRVVADADLRAALGAAARRRAVERFDEQRVFADVVKHYRRLLGGPATAPARIRRAAASDVPALARLHGDVLPESFMARLGTRFLRRFYAALLSDPNAVVLVADAAGAVVGFATGSASLSSFARRFYVRNALRTAPALLRGGALRRAFESARYARKHDAWPDAELVSLAVSPDARGRGVGRLLTAGIVAALGELGAREVKVFTAETNDAATGLFRAMNFRHGGRIAVHRERVSNVWIADCPS